mmetsp:Transcript_49867/g.55675  ORF Transcript_49867/g.55675 Transcript_49867/m.55675 type:complete len:124 (+) Transcript_49867:87-458(+)|eukprot:CAMPEP_0170794148 /NCGR_PEP_ID=MMETSP0733-20121128/23192_1 /TAXON_ID=186038 /ORGANISM="Fragilariopsis kerguelensis, Strain L26-C5" /LENGTH=123 /DNA_ID=CAMNT_0011143463 /DNA_START=87 /DNA_END=458 /DNA_ORIENTATION=-
MSAEEVAKAFTAHYYAMRESGDAGQLSGLFNEKSMMTFEGVQIMGGPAIIAKMTSIGRVKHVVKTTDVQPSPDGQSIIIFVTGNATMMGQENAIHFSEHFLLMPSGPGQYFVNNNIFRLNYGM